MKTLSCGALCVAVMLLAGILCGCAADAGSAQGTHLRVEITAFNVGKADAILVRVGEKSYLIDAGLKKAYDTLEEALARENVTHLDGVFLTHVDKDHGGGMQKLAKSSIGIDAFYGSPYFFEKTMEDNQIVKAAEERGMSVTWLHAGDSVTIDGQCRFDVVGPLVLDEETENNNSLVMRLVTPEGCALLTGDMEKEGEALVLASGAALDAVYLKVAHHGRDDATGESFAAAVKPEIAVISTDSEEEPRSASPVVISILEEADAQVYVTENFEHGVKVILEGGHALLAEP